MRDQLTKIEGHVDTGIGASQWLTIQVNAQARRAICRRPSTVAQRIGRHKYRRERRWPV
jgi:hypothetical protein